MDGSGLGKGGAMQNVLQSGSPRVLNAYRVGMMLKEAEPDAALLFQTAALNRAVLFKDIHTEKTQGGESKVRVGTKVYVPFDGANPSDGGMTVFFSRYTFMNAIRELVDISDPRRKEELAADMAVLELLDTLPTFAPFLVRDCFERANLKINPAYCMIPEDEWKAIQLYIRTRLEQILVSVSGGPSAARKSAMDKLVDKLWDLKDIPALQGLATAFGLDPATCLDTFYGWKGILYFAYAFQDLRDEIYAMLGWFDKWNDLAPVVASAYRPELKATCLAGRTGVARLLNQVERTLTEYEHSFDELFVSGTGPQRFVKFLGHASDHFRTCGAGLGLLQHTHELWDRATRPFPNRRPNAEVLTQVLTSTADIVGGA